MLDFLRLFSLAFESAKLTTVGLSFGLTDHRYIWQVVKLELPR